MVLEVHRVANITKPKMIKETFETTNTVLHDINFHELLFIKSLLNF